jgi:hypothetical protein
MYFRIVAACVWFTFVAVPCAEVIGQDKTPEPRKVVRIGAVGGSTAKTAMANLTTYLSRQGFPSDYVIYASYAHLVDALDRGEVDIAWNAPLAHAQYHLRKDGACQTLAMRETDVGLQLALIAPTNAKIQAPSDLAWIAHQGGGVRRNSASRCRLRRVAAGTVCSEGLWRNHLHDNHLRQNRLAWCAIQASLLAPE